MNTMMIMPSISKLSAQRRESPMWVSKTKADSTALSMMKKVTKNHLVSCRCVSLQNNDGMTNEQVVCGGGGEGTGGKEEGKN